MKKIKKIKQPDAKKLQAKTRTKAARPSFKEFAEWLERNGN